MPQKNNKNDIKEDFEMKEGESSLSEFVKRSLPSEKEVEKFDNFALEEAKEEEIEESLSEIYQDEKGNMVNVKKMDVKKRRGAFFLFFYLIVILAILGGVVYGAYYFFMKSGAGLDDIKLSFDGKSEIISDEEFFYTLSYKNLNNVDIKNIEINFTYPEGFVFLESYPGAEAGGIWKFGDLPAHRSGEIRIKGKIIGQQNERKVIFASMTYVPLNFSSEFKKEASFETTIKDIGLDFSIEANSSVLVGEENEISIKYKAKDINYLSDFRLIVDSADNIIFSPREEKDAKPGVYVVKEIGPEEKEIKVRFKLKEKIADNQDIILNFEHSDDGEKYYKFLAKIITLEVVKNNLNLNLIINGSRDDQGIDFGESLNYSIAYANKGETEMKDVIIMAVFESFILDWNTLSDKNNGQAGASTISWSKNEIPALASIKSGDEGIIDFFIKALPLAEVGAGSSELDLARKYEVKSYAQFSIGQSGSATTTPPTAPGSEDTKSNVIVNKINSDLKLSEEVRYFNEDNIAVGSGPLPPKVGQATSLKVFWHLTNNLHELENLSASVNLPSYAAWDNKARTTVGSLDYDSAGHRVVWNVGRLPITVYEADAEFNISVTPTEADKNKIMVLISGTKVEAIDVETQSAISKTMPAKTTKLEDDEIAASDGIVE